MDDTMDLDAAGLRGATFVVELESDWRFLDSDGDRVGVAGDIFAGYDPRAFLSGDAATDARDVAGHVLHSLLAGAADYRWLAWCAHYADRRARSVGAATALLALDAADAARAAAILDDAFGPATRAAEDEDLADLTLLAAGAVATAVRQAHAMALAAPPARSPWLIDLLAVGYAHGVAEYDVPGSDRYAAMYELAERMADSYEEALAHGLPPEWAVEAAQLVNWSDELLASPSGYTMQVYMYADTALRDYAEELAEATVRAYLAAHRAGSSGDEGEAAALAAFRMVLARHAEEAGEDDAEGWRADEDADLVRRIIAVYERAASGVVPPAPPRHETNPLLDLVQGVTDVYRAGRAEAARQSDLPDEDRP